LQIQLHHLLRLCSERQQHTPHHPYANVLHFCHVFYK
jgi:hypothetical protein